MHDDLLPLQVRKHPRWRDRQALALLGVLAGMVMLTEPKYCEFCTQQFFRRADAPIAERTKYCPACERAFAHAAKEQAGNHTLIGRRYDEYVN